MQREYIIRVKFLKQFPTVRHFRCACRERHIAQLIPQECKAWPWDDAYTLGQRAESPMAWQLSDVAKVWELCSGQSQEEFAA
jgi:hypothetical protein